MTARGTLSSVQALRGVAALLVVALHTDALLRQLGWQAPLGHLVALRGFAGVDLFFVLSGMLMTLTTAGRLPGPGAAMAFLRARLLRIVPLYWLLTAAKVLALWLAPALLLRPGAPDWPLAAASFLFVPLFEHGAARDPVLYQGWTLNYEMFFYLLFALLLVFTRRRLVAVLTLALAALALAGWGQGGWAGYYGHTLVLEFVFGCWAGAWLARGASLPRPVAVACALAAGALLLWPLQGLPRGIVLGVPAALLVLACVSLERRGAWPRLALLHRIGDSSYSLYLSHIFAQSLAARLLLRIDGLRALPADALFAAVVLWCAAVGWVVYIALERPLARSLRRRGPLPAQMPANAA